MTTIKAGSQAGTPVNEAHSVMPELKFIDYDELLKRTEGDTDLMVSIIDIYLKHTPLVISKMRELCSGQNWSTLATEAHSFKSAPVYFGLELPRNNAIKIEELAKQEGDVSHIINLIEEIALDAIQTTRELDLLREFLSAKTDQSSD